MSTTNPAGRRGRRARDVLEPVPETVPQQSQLVEPTPPETPADPPAVLEQQKPSTELTLPERALAAMKLAVTVEQLTDLAAKTADITAITNADARTQAHVAAMVLADTRIAIEKAGKVAREDAVKFQKEVINQAGKLVALIEPEEKRLLALRDAWDAAREAERKARAEADARRLAAIHERIQAIRDTLTDCAGKDAAGIQATIVATTALAIDDSYADLKGLAENVQANVLARLRAMHGDRVKLEEERAAQAAEQAKRKADLDAEIAKQRAERQLTNERLAKIRVIGNLVLVATTGRSPDRKPGTRLCITETITELQSIAITETDFGDLYQSAVASKQAAAEQLDHILQRFDEREEQQARQEQERERQRIEQQRIDAEREAAQAEQRRIAEENARQADELRRQQEEIDRQRLELERSSTQLSHVAVASIDITGEVMRETFRGEGERLDVTVETPLIHATAADFQPTAEQLIELVACNYGVGPDMAAKWCRDAFAPVLL